MNLDEARKEYQKIEGKILRLEDTLDLDPFNGSLAQEIEQLKETKAQAFDYIQGLEIDEWMGA